MNLMDKKAIGATVATAALVTAVAATVIHGRATVSGAGQELTIKDGQTASVAPGKGPVEVLTAGDPTAVEIVFSGEQRWVDQKLETMESAIDHLQLPAGSTIGAVSYSTGATLRAEATPASRFGAGWLGYATLYRGANGSDLIQGVTMGLAELSKSKLPRKMLVIVGDGNDTNNSDAAREALLGLQKRGWKLGAMMHAVLVPPFTATPSLVDAAGIPTVDGSKVELTHALADIIGAQVQPPRAVMVVFEGRGTWLNVDVLHAVGAGISEMDLPPDSRIAAIEYSTGAEIRIPFEAATRFNPAQLGSARDYAGKTGSDLITGVTMGLERLAKAPEPDKILVVVGDGHNTDDEAAAGMAKELVARAREIDVRIHAIQYGSIDNLPGTVLKRLDPHISVLAGDYKGRLGGLQMSLGLAAQKVNPLGADRDER